MIRTVWHNGNLSIGSAPGGTGSLTDGMNTTFTGVYQASSSVPISAASNSDAFPQSVNLGSITKLRFLAIKVTSGTSIKVLLTSAAGSTQALLVSGIFVWHSPNAGDEITALDLVGTAELEVILAGDLS